MKLSQFPEVDVVADLANKDNHVINSYFAICRFETQDKKDFWPPVLRRLVSDTSQLESEISRLEKELADLTSELEGLIKQNARIVQNQEVYRGQYDELARKCETSKSFRTHQQNLLEDKQYRSNKLKEFIQELRKHDRLIADSDKKLWNTMVEQVTITKDKSAIFTFKSGQDIEVD